ncbi:MAG: 2-oxo acid dehydrogenase subunit E2, partial [Hyphomicrobiales bacterium]|nr:2-oxo acid dehydrogenase subunit E2 [Hyphomicrobiales bacterium]
MGARSIKLPDVGEGVAEAEIVEWSVKVGDLVREDQVVAAVMTDKATVEIPSPVAGTVIALGGGVGDVLAVGSELIRIEAPGLPDALLPQAPKAKAEAAAPAEPAPVDALPAAPAGPRASGALVDGAPEARDTAPPSAPASPPRPLGPGG